MASKEGGSGLDIMNRRTAEEGAIELDRGEQDETGRLRVGLRWAEHACHYIWWLENTGSSARLEFYFDVPCRRQDERARSKLARSAVFD